jgi:hypothetical protein
LRSVPAVLPFALFFAVAVHAQSASAPAQTGRIDGIVI